ncbi:Tetratricopeptide repeat-containing protein [Salipiger abyssi]|uniref:Tetratricopeptide repeat-containing protein n=1 Tax=Salipiger abyssi TaxID=1250539 RepID=A0A1P8UYF6_9RHOB|nr:Tetratricopeptide repeat-containing protein [Salipiger abyssi]
MGPEHPDTLTSVNNLAVLYRSTGRYGEAEPLYRRALEARERVLGPEHPDTLRSVNNLAALYENTGRYGEAEPLFRRALEASEEADGYGPMHPTTVVYNGNLAFLLANSDRPQDALRAFRQIDQRLDQWLRVEVSNARSAAMRRELLTLNSNYQDASFSFVLQNPSRAGTRFAADLTLKWKKRIAQEDAVLNNLVRETDDSAVLDLIAKVKAGRAGLSRIAFDPAISTEDKTRRRETLEAAEAELRAASEKFRRFQRVSAASADDVSLALPRNSALVEYKLFDPFDFETGDFGEQRLLAVVLRPDADPALVDLGEAGVYFTSQALIANSELRAEHEVPFDAVMRHSFNTLIAPLADHLSGAGTLYISPDGPLGALPFEAFLTETGTRLIERFDLRTLQTGRDLVARDRPATGKGLVAFGGIDFDAIALAGDFRDTNDDFRAALDSTRQQFSGFKALEQSASEVTYIGDLYGALRTDEPSPKIFTGQRATEAALKSLQSTPRVLHLATHGYYLQSGSIDGRPLLQSGVTFAGANNALAGKLGADGENGILHALEAQTLNLYGTELVVLSACETGQGAHDYSEGLEGLPRAFYVAGAQNVLAALWPVGDRSAKEFMQRFYDNWLAQTGASKPAAALRKTKLEYLASTDAQDRDPANWAPFVLFEG